MKIKPAIIEAVRFSVKVSGNPMVELRNTAEILRYARAGVRRGVLLVALRELETEGAINIIKRGRAFEDWDATLPLPEVSP